MALPLWESLAAQMLNDASVLKSPKMLEHISTVINDETKRLRFQVEKVLQMSMFDRQKATLKLQDLDANVVIANVVHTFKIKVDKYGGELKRKCGMTPANRHRMYFHHQAAFVRRNLQLDISYRTDTGLSGDFCFFKEAWIAGRRFRHVDVDVCVYDCNGISSRNRLRVIRDNIAVVRRFDSLPDMMRFLPRLYFVVVWDKLRHLL